MADFDNGLPLEGTTTDAEISNVSMATAPEGTTTYTEISDVLMVIDPEDTRDERFSISHTSLDRSPAGRNFVTML